MGRTDASADTRPVLVTGGAGFIGSNLADRLASEGHRVIVYDAMSRPGVERNLAWLQSRHGDRIEHIPPTSATAPAWRRRRNRRRRSSTSQRRSR